MFKTIIPLFVCILAGVSASAQPLGVGLKLGVPINDAFKVFPRPTFSPFNAEGQPYQIGGYLEIRLPGKWAVEADALHRSYNFQSAVTQTTGSAWEFPVLIKKRFGSEIFRPYVEAGAAFSRLSDVRFSTLQHRSRYGAVAGVGVEINLLLLKLSPEIRYTGWNQRNFDTSDLQSARNQLTVLVSFGF